ncbi:hypothetical protein [Aeromicrobium chenweiae]|uniref:Uncharacterized protein n=1 Tax=Aeromicrobium chenweiae TaxID=2079793 RepID=A0A2S0WHK9_9ACTN|nr:hypothetical protein [Aeromicrobium chenweiae]AWB90825.1 hypothetical protein C3E78_00455 [Aeromicrobium chenweiae]TGN31088.1 hypothetical protein E4L97_15925 [Aeromicrobium chenweiae]
MIVAIVAGVLSLFTASTAYADYEPPPFSADAPEAVEPGGQFTITFTSGGVNCAWTSTFAGQTGAPGAGTEYSPSFTAPEEEGTYTATARCTWDPDVTSPVLAPISSSNSVTTAAAVTSDTTLLAAPQTDVYSVQIVVGTPGNDAGNGEENGSGDNASDEADNSSDTNAGGTGSNSNGVLPNAGAPAMIALYVGAALVAAGVAFTAIARRRKTA